jgi:hypothetical protein
MMYTGAQGTWAVPAVGTGIVTGDDHNVCGYVPCNMVGATGVWCGQQKGRR